MEPGSSEPGGRVSPALRTATLPLLQWSQVLANPEAWPLAYTQWKAVAELQWSQVLANPEARPQRGIYDGVADFNGARF